MFFEEHGTRFLFLSVSPFRPQAAVRGRTGTDAPVREQSRSIRQTSLFEHSVPSRRFAPVSGPPAFCGGSRGGLFSLKRRNEPCEAREGEAGRGPCRRNGRWKDFLPAARRFRSGERGAPAGTTRPGSGRKSPAVSSSGRFALRRCCRWSFATGTRPMCVCFAPVSLDVPQEHGGCVVRFSLPARPRTVRILPPLLACACECAALDRKAGIARVRFCRPKMPAGEGPVVEPNAAGGRCAVGRGTEADVRCRRKTCPQRVSPRRCVRGTTGRSVSVCLSLLACRCRRFSLWKNGGIRCRVRRRDFVASGEWCEPDGLSVAGASMATGFVSPPFSAAARRSAGAGCRAAFPWWRHPVARSLRETVPESGRRGEEAVPVRSRVSGWNVSRVRCSMTPPLLPDSESGAAASEARRSERASGDGFGNDRSGRNTLQKNATVRENGLSHPLSVFPSRVCGDCPGVSPRCQNRVL